MGCSSCGSNSSGVPSGCGSKGHCQTGGCNKMNTYDWLSEVDIKDPNPFDVVEVSFKNGSRKDFFKNELNYEILTGDTVVVDSGSGYDIGVVSLSGELVRLQLKKKRVPEDALFLRVLRVANERDIEKLMEARSMEQQTMVRARVMARTLGLDMKIGDVEFQGDKRKATFFYTAEGRVDFRELVRNFAKEFRVKIEMRQIGARQESAKIGGIGACGRELCCSTWLSDFRTVTTTAARYQNISINQTKLSGQCGRLKCCLNYELDTYMDALESFPNRAEYLDTMKGRAELIKTDIFKGLMFYTYMDPKVRGPIMTLGKEKVKEILKMNRDGQKPESLMQFSVEMELAAAAVPEIEFADVTGDIELPNERRSGNRRGGRNKKRGGSDRSNSRRIDRNTNEDRSKPEDRNKSDKRTKPDNRNNPKQKTPKSRKLGESPQKTEGSDTRSRDQPKSTRPNKKGGRSRPNRGNRPKRDSPKTPE